MSIRALLLAVLVLLAWPVKSNPIYKCINNEGRVTYSAMPCYGERWRRTGRTGPVAPQTPAAKVARPVSITKTSPGSSSAANSSAGNPAVNAAVLAQ